ncbi:MAG: 4Fe-4S dicluster domain-containing protein, partial [Bacteroidales bacterium]|nr:4Fe-4S dicluster domain-containing protein [Bacteroidales bacterium]
MISITDKVQCCGCNACGDVCSHDAITFKTDIEGFWYPEVDKEKCTDCGLCEKVCPIINVKELVHTFISFFINAYYPGKLFGYGAVAQIKDSYKFVISSGIMAI